jgi:hypothetical protein
MKTKHALGTVALGVVSLAILAPVVPVVAFALLGLLALATPLLVLAVPALLVGLLAFVFSPARVDLPTAEAGGPRLGAQVPARA